MMEYLSSEEFLPEVYGLEVASTEASPRSLLSTEQQLALMGLVRVSDPDAKRQVIAHNLRLVVVIAKRYSNHGVELVDLIRAGTMGLIHALKNFELEGGFRFASYARQCIRQCIERAITSQSIHPYLSAL